MERALRARPTRPRAARRRGQNMTEVIILVALVGIGMAFLTVLLPTAISKHYQENQKVLTSPL